MKIIIITVPALPIVHQEKYTIQKQRLLKRIMTLDFILDFFVFSHVPVSYYVRLLFTEPVTVIGNQFEQGTFCVSECQLGYHPMDRVCLPCPNGVCIDGKSKSYTM